jgi:hypothetical protein
MRKFTKSCEKLYQSEMRSNPMSIAKTVTRIAGEGYLLNLVGETEEIAPKRAGTLRGMREDRKH